MNRNQRKLLLLQDALFVLLSLVYINGGNTFFSSEETIKSLYINNAINVAVGIIFIILQYIKLPRTFLLSINIASTLFVVYNLIPVLLQQKSMFAVIIIIELLISGFLFVFLLRTSKSPPLFTLKERLLYGLIALLFSTIFITRGIILLSSSFSAVLISNEIAVAITDIVICSIWFISGLSLLFHKKFGTVTAPSVFIHASLLFITLLIHMILYPIMNDKNPDLEGLFAISVMSLFFIIPLIVVIRKKLTGPST